MEDQKQCEQCDVQKDLSAFYRRKNKTDGQMKICIECYMNNLHESQRRARELQQEREQQLLEEEKRKVEESDRAQVLLPTLLEGTKICQMCLQLFPTDNRGNLVVPFFTMHSDICHRCNKPLSIEYSMDGHIYYGCPGHISGSGSAWYGRSNKYCPTCREEQRKKNR